MEENPYQPVPTEAHATTSPVLLFIVVGVFGLMFATFIVGYVVGHAAGFWDAERLQIGDEAAGLEPGELP